MNLFNPDLKSSMNPPLKKRNLISFSHNGGDPPPLSLYFKGPKGNFYYEK